MTSLTMAEATERARVIEVVSYRIDVDLAHGEDVFRSTSVVRFRRRVPGAGTFVEIKAQRVLRVVLNGVGLDPSLCAENRIPLSDLLADNELVVEADMAYSGTGDGAHRFLDPSDGRTYVGIYCGVDVAQQVFACFDQPDLKAVFEVTAHAPTGWTVVGNGRSRPVGGGSGRWRFDRTPPLPTYLFVLVAGPLHTVRAQHNGMPFALHCRASLADFLDRDAAELFAITHACFDRYLQMFDEPYPFDSYDQAFVPGLNWGALETPGCVTFRDEFLFRSAVTRTERQARAVVIAHEMAHMWFGDLVTMRWWDDLWLSESFAEYMGFQVVTEVTEFTGAWTDFAVTTKIRGYDADQRPSTHPIAPGREDVGDADTALSNADGITYAKGASALRQLVAWLGAEPFLRGVNDFLTRHRFRSATRGDLVAALSAASGHDVDAWARQWLDTTGVDRTSVSRLSGGDSAVIERRGSRPHRLQVGLYDRGAGDPHPLILRERIDVTVTADRTVVALPPGDPPALIVVNDGDLDYCKVGLDADSWATVTDSLSTIPDPVTRAVVWTAARDRIRDGEAAPSSYLRLMSRHARTEADAAIVRSVLHFARYEIADRYLDPDLRPAALDTIAGTCRSLLGTTGAHPSTDVHLAALRVLIDCAGPRSVTDLVGWLAAGETPYGGPTLDADLRWRALLRLCVLGAAARAEIDAELRRDPSATGIEAATGCRAAIPDYDAKRIAWTSMFGTSAPELSTRLFSASGRGFWWPEQAPLLDEFVSAFFPAAVEVARRRGNAFAKALGNTAYPHHAVDVTTLQAGRRCLEYDDPPVVLRRDLVDRLDDMRRALSVRSGRQSGNR